MDFIAARNRVWRLVAGLVLAAGFAPAAVAQSVAAGDTYFNNPANCASCHTGGPASPYPAGLNAANAASVITHAINAGMTALNPTATERTSIAMYINSVLPSPSPNNQSVPFNPGGASFTTLTTNLVIPSPYGALDGFQQMSAPSKGTLTFGASNPRYTPDACALGADSFTYRGTGPGGPSNTRSGSVTIANPTTPPTISTAAPPDGQTGVFYSHNVNVTACESIVTYSISFGSLPAGLSLNTSTGVISGTPTTLGTSNGTLRATYPGGQFDSQAFSITITLGPPNITSSTNAADGSVDVAYGGYTIVATNSPTSYGATGLPPGLTVDTATGAITGTPTSAAGSPYFANVSATNATGTDNQVVRFDVVPAINSAATASGQTGVAFSYQITEGPGPAFTTHTALDPLPPGLTLDAATGLISGTPTVVGGPTNVRLRGGNGFGNSAQFTLAITITLGPPQITSLLTANGGATLPFSYTITATNSPTSFNATGLPAGLAVDTTTGAITGTPSPGSGGVYNVNISATNATGTDNEVLVLTISENPPVITSSLTANGTTGTPFSYQITATNGVVSYGASGLPAGLAIDTATGLISGTPVPPAGLFNVTITATNGSGSDSETLALNLALGPPVITSAATAGGAEGFAFSYQITATNAPTSYGATGLPPGVSVNTSTGLISGTPTAMGTFNATISATNATATANQALTITIGIGLPVITSAATASGGTGLAFVYQITASNAPTSFGATGLPPGLVVDTATGRISGTATTAGSYPVNLSATNGTGTGTRLLTITINLRPPTVAPTGTVTGIAGVNFSYTVQVGNGATGYAADGLPPGLAINTASGAITGVPTTGGTYDATISVTNAAGTTTFVLRFVIGFQLPTAGDASVDVVFQTPTPIELPVTGESITVAIVTLPEHGLVTVTAGSATVVYTPAVGYSGPDSFAYTVTNPAGTTAAATVNIVVGTLAPQGVPITLTAPINSATTVDFTALVPGSGLTGISIRNAPAHGTVSVNGMQVTYTPRTDYFGPDSFTYIAFGNAGTSTPATVTVDVVGRPDPSADRDVVGLIDAQNQAARRFAGAQISNYQRRMESLHRTPVEPAAPPATPSPSAPPKPVSTRDAPRVAVADAASTKSDAPGLLPASLVTQLMHAVTSRSLDLSSASSNGNANGGAARTAPEFWIAGTAHFGRRDATGERSGLEFGTDGISIGADRRFGDRLAMGLGVGYGQDDTDVGTGRTRSKARGASVAAYGSYQPTPRTFIDLLLGYGHLRFDSERYVESLDGVARARRKGNQLFGSAAAGYELRRDNLLVSPYGRVDFSIDRLDAASEEGVGNYALAYREQDQRAFQVAAGVRAESKHETEFGFAVPRLRAEYRRELEGDRTATIAYADLFGGPEYTVRPAGTSRNSLLLGVGGDLVFRGGLRIGIDYTAQRASGASNVQGVRILVSQELDARGAPPWRFEPVMFRYPVTVDAGYAWDDNVNRAREPGERLTDSIFSLSLNQSRHWPMGANMRVQLTGLLSGEKFDRFQGLGRVSAGGQGEIQYRSSGAYDATTFGVVGRALYEKFESDHRTGPRYFAGVNARRALTDRIELFGELGANWRDGRSEVFRWRDYSAKLNVDYSLGRRGIVYLTGEYRRGDTVSSGFPSLANVGLAEIFVPDDAFDELGLTAYRFDARTVFSTLGWNLPLGARDSVDFSWRRIQSTPTKRWSLDSGPSRYIDNQYSIVYLMRF